MRFKAYVFNWRRPGNRAPELVHRLRELAETVVINSDPDRRAFEPQWIHLPESAFFSEQWNVVLATFDADVMFHIQADAYVDDMGALFTRARSLFERLNVGIYEPNIDHTDIQYQRTSLRPLERDVFEIPVPDCTCWFIAGDIVRACPKVDPDANRFGWGINTVVAALAGLQGLRCVRDYSMVVTHPRLRGYSTHSAISENLRYLRRLPAAIRNEAIRRLQHRMRCRL